MSDLALVLVCLFIGWLFGIGLPRAAFDDFRRYRLRSTRVRRLHLSTGSLGNVRRATPAHDGRADASADGHPLQENRPRSGNGEALAPVVPIHGKRQQIEVLR